MNLKSPPAITIEKLLFSYGKKQQPVLKIADWQIEAGQRVFLSGASGSGKSTLLNLLSGMLVPQSGEIRLLGQAFSSLSARKRDKFRARHIGVVFQQFNLVPYLSVQANIELAAYFAGGKQYASTRARQLLQQLQLPASLLNQRADALSVGQQQRVAIARALINQPELLIVDEPTSALDANARDAFIKLLLACCDQQQSTLLFVSHDASLAQYFESHQSIQQINNLESVLCN